MVSRKLFDRMKAVQTVEALAPSINKVGMLKYAFDQVPQLFCPASSHVDDSGVYGDVMQNILGPAYSGAGIPDYLHVELKTANVSSDSAITLGAMDPSDLDQAFLTETILFNKCRCVVFVLIEPTGKNFEHQISPNYKLCIPDMKIKQVLSFDDSNNVLFDLLETDFQNIKRDRANQEFVSFATEVFDKKSLNSSNKISNKPKCTGTDSLSGSALRLERKKKGSSSFNWRLGKKFVLNGIEATNAIDIDTGLWGMAY